jgi:hypothetical protein
MEYIFRFNNTYNYIPVNYLPGFSDRVDGLTDTINLEFLSSADLLPFYVKNQPVVFSIYDDTRLIKEMKMILIDFTRKLNSTSKNNNALHYTYSCTLAEPTLILDESFRTDITITKGDYKGDAYPTLWEAYLKVMTCHNLNQKNIKVYNTFKNSKGSLVTNFEIPISDIQDKNNIHLSLKSDEITYNLTDNVTYVVPKLDIKDEKVPFNISIPVVRLDGTVFPPDATTEYLKISADFNTTKDKIIITQDISDLSDTYVTYTDFVYEVSWFLHSGRKLYELLSAVACPNLTYIDLSTYSQLEDIFARVGAKPYLTFDNDNKFYVDFFLEQGEVNGEIKEIKGISSEETGKLSDYTYNSVSSKVINLSCDNDLYVYPTLFTEALKELNYPDTLVFNPATYNLSPADIMSGTVEIIGMPETERTDDVITVETPLVLVPEGYNEESQSIKDANAYSLILPTNIERIQDLYVVKEIENNKLELTKVTNKVLEYTAWKSTEGTQQRTYAYYVRGENAIRQCVALTASKSDLELEFPWDKDNVYRALRKCFVVAVYKPMFTTNFNKYTYDTIGETTTLYEDLPYKVINDKQVNTILEFNKEKYTNKQTICKVVTQDVNELKHFAGEKVYYKHKILKDDDFKGIFSSLEELRTQISTMPHYDFFHNLVTPYYDYQWWAKIGDDVYTINELTNSWEIYKGELCVITKMDVAFYNKMFEITYELSDKIATNSAYSRFSDNVRISDNSSTEATVTRITQINKTFLLSCNAGDKFRPEGFTEDILRTPSLSLYPDETFKGNKCFLDGYDILLYGNAMRATGAFGDFDNSAIIGNINAFVNTGLVTINPEPKVIDDGSLLYYANGNQNSLWIKSNTLITCISQSYDPMSMGTKVNKLNTNGSNIITTFTSTIPLLFKTSYNNEELYGISVFAHNAQTRLTYKFIDYLKEYGFVDLKVDIRERQQVIMQYNIIPNQYKKFCTDRKLWEEYQGRYPLQENTILNVVEINSNFEWLDNIFTPTIKETKDITIKLVPKNLTIQDYYTTNTDAFETYSATGSLHLDKFKSGDDYHYSVTPEITLTGRQFISQKEHNYMILIDNVPLCTISSEGIKPTNSIVLNCFLT